MSETSLRRQWAQLLALMLSHALADLFAGMVSPLLPALRDRFTMTLSEGVTLITVLFLVCNGVQMLIGWARSREEGLFFLPVGLVLSGAIALVGVVIRLDGGVGWLFVLAAVTGVGVAFVHPEGLRAIYRIDKIPTATCSAVFMLGGFAGFLGGAWGSTYVVSRWGLIALAPLALCPVMMVLVCRSLRMRLAADHSEAARTEAMVKSGAKAGLPFWQVVLMMIPSVVGATVVMNLLPSRLNELGFSLPFGGVSVTVLGAGGVLGSFFWAWLARRRDELACVVVAMLGGIPFVLAYLGVLEHRWAIWLLLGVGFFAAGCYPLQITIARHSRGPRLGVRMSIAVGGTSLVGSMAMWGLGVAADSTTLGLQEILHVGYLGFALSGVIGLVILYRRWPAGS